MTPAYKGSVFVICHAAYLHVMFDSAEGFSIVSMRLDFLILLVLRGPGFLDF